MNNLTKAFSYLIAAQFQAIGLILAAWWIGDWLNSNHPISITWYAVTFPIGVIGVFHSFYVIIKHVLRSPNNAGKSDGKK